MLYYSTRGASAPVFSAQAVLAGLAPDGGLYLPETLPDFDWRGCLTLDTQAMAVKLLSALLPDLPDMPALVHEAYHGKFASEDLTPTVKVGDNTVLELFRGPTSAFKDVALCMLPQLLTAAKRVTGETADTLILTATSGDTGKAALEGFRDVSGTRICVFYPDGGVSRVQRAQMVTQEGANVAVCAVRGNFDDAQTGVKNIFSACRGRTLPVKLSSANSINIGRLAPQLTYYFAAYRDLVSRGEIAVGDPVNFAVPTGNFGDILAGYLAKRLGLPVGKLLCASNANRVLTDFFATGVYDRRRELVKTESPSMDILVSSNLERLLALLTGDTSLVAEWMAQLQAQGVYRIPDTLLDTLRESFGADTCSDTDGRRAIGHVWQEYGYLMDPHTAAGWVCAERYRARTHDTRPMVVLSTASPYKFPAAVLHAIGAQPEGDGFALLSQLEALTGVPVPPNLAALAGKPERHLDCVEKSDMLDYVLRLTQK